MMRIINSFPLNDEQLSPFHRAFFVRFYNAKKGQLKYVSSDCVPSRNCHGETSAVRRAPDNHLMNVKSPQKNVDTCLWLMPRSKSRVQSQEFEAKGSKSRVRSQGFLEVAFHVPFCTIQSFEINFGIEKVQLKSSQCLPTVLR